MKGADTSWKWRVTWGAGLVLAMFALGRTVCIRFGDASRAFIGPEGSVSGADTPVLAWTPFVWPVVAFLVGVVISWTCDATVGCLGRLLGASLAAFGVFYGLAVVVALCLGMDGLFGLLGYHGEAGVWSPTRTSMHSCPFVLLLGVTAFATQRNSQGSPIRAECKQKKRCLSGFFLRPVFSCGRRKCLQLP